MPPLTIQQAFALAVQHHRAGRLREAEQLYRLVLAREPGHSEALNYLGAIAHKTGHHQVAIDLLGKSIALQPADASAHYNLADALRGSGRFDEAAAAYSRAVALNPNFAEAFNNLGITLKNLGRFSEASAAFHRAIALNPRLVEVYSNLGNLLESHGQFDEAIAAYRQALALCPNLPQLHTNLGTALRDKGELDEAIAAWRRAMALDPNHAEAHSNLLYTLHFHPGYDAARIADEHRQFDRRHAEPLRRLLPGFLNDRTPERRLRIGYVSPFFRNHATSFFTHPLLAAHDHRQFEVFCYSDVTLPDQTTEKLKPFADVWRPVRPMSDEQLAALIRQDRIDILVDLTMHMAEGRPLLFARKPAPVQVAWLAYPGTTGLGTMDYRLTDPYLDPPGMNEAHYSEIAYWLPETALCYDPLTTTPPVNALPALANGHVTFGSLNQICKAGDRVLQTWAAALAAVPESKMLVLAPAGSPRQRVERFAAAAGVDPRRIEFLDRQPRPQYLEYFHRIDLVLDTWPYNGETTSLDGLWMGVPMVTLCGQTAPSRAGWCYLTHLGLTDMVAPSPEQYVHVAARLAGDLPRLARLRSTLRGDLERSPLMDGPRFARNVEGAYRQMWRKWCERR